MLYRKNLPGWERAMRAVGGAAMIACGLLGLPAWREQPDDLLGGGVAVLGLPLEDLHDWLAAETAPGLTE
jgi:hypothetical protein